jgi:hypothetical protein
MSYYDEDFYHAPSEFEQQVDEFKTALLNSVRDEFKAEMEQLRAENAELQEVRKNMDQIKRNHHNKLNELNIAKNDAMRIVRRERLSELMKDFQVVMYRADTTRELGPKCDKCNERRYIQFKSPSGKDHTEPCDCSNGKLMYVPVEYIVCEFSIDSHNSNQMRVWYKLKPSSSSGDDYGSYDNSSFRKTIYTNAMPFDKIERYETFFKTVEECQAYCDWMNENKAD